MTRLLQILPRTDGPVCGISDYGRLLAQELRDEHDIHSSFLAVGSGGNLRQRTEEFRVFDLPHATADALVHFIASTQEPFQAVLLHMSAYGYQKRGVPLWLAAAWRQIFSERQRPALLTMFHELSASGPPTTSAFWLRPLQQFLLRIVAWCSDGVRTNRTAYADWLRQASGSEKREIPVMPVFSNMGEAVPLAAHAHADERFHRMTVFASTVGPASFPLLAEICREKEIKCLGWIGAAQPPALGGGVQVHHLSHLPGEKAGEWFQEHGVAFTGYNPEFLAKSGIFAAFAAHEVAVLLPTSQAELPDHLSGWQHFIPAAADSPSVPWEQQARQASSGLQKWYRTHDLKATAASYAAQVQTLASRAFQS
ncbi:MAG TPA: hypothetical protein VGE29_13065 [Prosthecobacter sp.]